MNEKLETPLSARVLVNLLAPRWALDQVYVDGLVARDAHLREDDRAVVLAFEGAGQVFRISFAPKRGGPFAAQALGLAITHEPCEHGAKAKALCRRIAHELSSHTERHWKGLRDAPPTSLAEEVSMAPAPLPAGARALRSDLRHYAMLYGPVPSVHRVFVQGASVDGESIHYPAPWRGPVPASAAIYPAPVRVRRRRALRLHFARLGCVFDDTGMPRTVPTPRTLNQALHARGRHVPLRWVRRWSGPLQGPEWVRYLLRERALPVTVAPRAIARAHVLVRRLAPRLSLAADVGMLVHDASLHGLVFSDLPSPRWDAWASRAARVLRQGRAAAQRIAEFYENDLTRACWAAWSEAHRVADSAIALEARAEALDASLREIERRYLGAPC